MDYEVLNEETVIDQDAVETQEQPEAEQETTKSKNVPLILAIVALGVVVADFLLFGILSVLNMLPLIGFITVIIMFFYNGLRFFLFWGSLACAIVALIMSIKSKKLDAKQKKTALILSIIALVALALLDIVVPIVVGLLNFILALPFVIIYLIVFLPLFPLMMIGV